MRHGFLYGIAISLTILILSILAGCGSGSGGSSTVNAAGDMDVGGVSGPYGDLLPNAEELWSARVKVDADFGSLEQIHLLQTPDVSGKVHATLYLIGSNHKVVAMGENGQPRWTFERMELPPVFPPVEGPTAVAFVTRDKLWIVNRMTGEQLTGQTLPCTPSAPPALSRSTAYIPALSDNRIYTVAINDGAVGWKKRLGSHIKSAPVMSGSVGRPALAVATITGSVFSFDAVASTAAEGPGEPLWKVKLANGVVADLSVSNDASVLFVPSEDYMLHAYEASTGAKKWDYPAKRPLTTSAVEVNGMVFQKNADKLVAIDLATGQVKWTVDRADRPICKWGDNYLVLGPNHSVRRLNGKDGAELAVGQIPEDFVLCDTCGGRFVVADRGWNLRVLKYRKY